LLFCEALKFDLLT